MKAHGRQQARSREAPERGAQGRSSRWRPSRAPRIALLLALGLACTAGCKARPRPRPNLVLISIDTLRADRVAGHGAPRPDATTPHLDAWARGHATVFRQAIAPAPWTLPSHASLLTGLDALRHAANRSHYPLPAGVQTLAQALAQNGYATAAVTGGGWLAPTYGLLRGFERTQEWSDAGRGDAEWERHAADAAALLDSLPPPFFLFVHTFAVHDFPRAPRLPPDTPDDERARLYDAAVRHMDRHLGRLLARLAEPSLRARTAVVVTADHGEALGDPKAGGGRDYGHGSLRDPVLRVPLVLALPGDATYRPPGLDRLPAAVDRQVSLVDVAPTLADLAGLTPSSRPGAPAAPTAFDGASLLSLLRGDASAAAPHLAVSYFARPGHGLALRQDGRWKYLLDDSATVAGANDAPLPREALFDLAADPGETTNVASGHAETPTWRALAQHTLRERTAGIALTLHAGSAGVTLTLGGPLWRDGTPTLLDALSPRLRAADPHRAGIVLPPGARLELLLQPTVEPILRIEAASTPPPLDLRHTPLPARLRFDGHAWQVGAPERSSRPMAATSDRCPAVACARLAWRGSAHAERWGAPAPLDPKLRERLRALGYVE